MNNYDFEGEEERMRDELNGLGMYSRGFPGLKKKIYIFDRLFEKLDPVLYHHFVSDTTMNDLIPSESRRHRGHHVWAPMVREKEILELIIIQVLDFILDVPSDASDQADMGSLLSSGMEDDHERCLLYLPHRSR